MATSSPSDLIGLTVEIVAAHLSNNPVAASDVPALITQIHSSLASLRAEPTAPAAPKGEPAVPIRNSVTPDHIICLEDGRRLKMLKGHLRNAYGMTPDQYRAKWGLPADYPMTAPNYSIRRSQLAKSFGLGTDHAGKDETNRSARGR